MRKAFLAVVLAIALSATGTLAFAGTVTVKAADGSRFMPKIKSVSRGTKVVWKNTDNITHNVTSVSKNWSKGATISPGSTTAFTFKRTGTFRYRCTLHSTLSGGVCSGMCGKIVVG